MESMPEFSPLYPEPPHHFKDTHTIAVYGRGDEDGIREFLPDALEYVSDKIRFGIYDNREIDGLSPYFGATIHVQAAYNGTAGGTLLNEWVTEDDVMAVGRELWGYPKKIGEISYEETGDTITGSATQDGENIFSATFEPADVDFKPESMMPRLQVKRIPSGDSTVEGIEQIIKMSGADEEDGHPGLEIFEQRMGSGEIELGELLAPLGPIEVRGATYLHQRFTLDYGEDVTAKDAER